MRVINEGKVLRKEGRKEYFSPGLFILADDETGAHRNMTLPNEKWTDDKHIQLL